MKGNLNRIQNFCTFSIEDIELADVKPWALDVHGLAQVAKKQTPGIFFL